MMTPFMIQSIYEVFGGTLTKKQVRGMTQSFEGHGRPVEYYIRIDFENHCCYFAIYDRTTCTAEGRILPIE